MAKTVKSAASRTRAADPELELDQELPASEGNGEAVAAIAEEDEDDDFDDIINPADARYEEVKAAIFTSPSRSG